MARNRLIDAAISIDDGIQLVLRVISGILIVLTVIFTLYTVYMRYVIEDPPFWGDTVALFANIWLVMLALAVAVRTRGQIAMTAVYQLSPPVVSYVLEIIWNAFVVAFGIFLVYYGWIAARETPSMYWELNNFSKTYPMLIIPIAGFLITIASAAVIVEDVIHIKKGDLKQSYFEHYLRP